MNAAPLIGIAGVTLTLSVILLAIGGGGSGNRDLLHKRARQLAAGNVGHRRRSKSGKGETATLKRDEVRSVPFLEELARRFLPRQTALKDRLGRTGHDISIGSYVLCCLALVLAGFLLAHFGLKLPPAAAASLAIVVGLGLPHAFVGLLIRRYQARFLALLPDAVDLIVRGLKAGLPVTESIGTVGREMTHPIAGEFRRITDSVRFGCSLSEVLWETAKRLDIPEFNFFVISLSIQRETGGNLAETLGNLSDILRRRRQVKLKIRALSSEAKAGAYILGAMPFLMFLLIYLINRSYALMLIHDPRGVVMLSIGLCCVFMAAAVMFKMIRFEI
jgi:tight adherence protein B